MAAITKIREGLGESVIEEVRHLRNEITLFISKEAILQVAKLLKEDPTLDYDFLSDICCIDWIGRAHRFEVVYHLYSLTHNSRLRLKVRLDEKEPSIASVVGVWPTANWHEREVFDLFGIEFVGHPDLRRILNPEEFKGFPYRKDFPIR